MPFRHLPIFPFSKLGKLIWHREMLGDALRETLEILN
jgi:hypothetical protein